MFILKKFHDNNFNKINNIIDSYKNFANNYINLVGSSSIPFSELSNIGSIPSTICRVEGHLNKRLFPLTEPIDIAEKYIEESIHKLFNIDNNYTISSQLHSATQANQVIYKALLNDGDAVMSLSLKYGGHISHKLGLPQNIDHYSFPILDNNINYQALEEQVIKIKPKILIGGGTSFPWEVDFEKLSSISKKVDAFLLADLAHIAPFIISGLHKSTFPYADIVTIDTSKSLRGPKGAILIFKKKIEKKIQYAIFPLTQSSPNQDSIIKKACCLNCWENQSILEYADKLINYSYLMQKEFNNNGITIEFGGSNSHIIILNTIKCGLSGVEAENILSENNILVNRNQIPNDKKDPWITSGIRISTTSLVILEYTYEDVVLLTKYISHILQTKKPERGILKKLLNKYHKNIINISNE